MYYKKIVNSSMYIQKYNVLLHQDIFYCIIVVFVFDLENILKGPVY